MKPIFTFPQPRRRLAEQSFHLKDRKTCPNKQSHRNPRGADRPYSLGAAQAAMCALATVENSTSSPGRVAGTGSAYATGRQYGREWSRPLVPGPLQSSLRGSLECLLPFARSSFTVRELLAKTSRTAVYGPVRTVVWQGSAGDCRPYADQVGF
jgi:hypothetical protein